MENVVNRQISLPYYTASEFNRILFFTDNRIDRNYVIWALSNQGMDQYSIADFIGCSQSVVNHTVLVCKAICDIADISEYFRIGFDLCDICYEMDLNPDKYVVNILNSMLRSRIISRESVKELTSMKLADFLETASMKRAGNKACDVFVKYWLRLTNNTKGDK